MEIQEIKSRLTLSSVLHHYNLKPDKNLRLLCPFHEDKSPSLQVYYKTHTAYCFSSNCKTHGKSLDVIDFIMNKENLSKHEAIIKAQVIAGITNHEPKIITLKPEPPNKIASHTDFLTSIFTYFKNGLRSSKPAQEYIKKRGLEYEKNEIGYNSGQFHHGTRKDETLIQNCLQTGLLIDKNLTSRTGEKAYQSFGKYCIVFALRNKANQVTGLYFRSTVNEEDSKHYYLKERSGLYPHYPKPETEKLILTEAIIDAASLLQIPEIINNYELLSCYGTNGLTKEHITAIKEWASVAEPVEAKEIIFAFDNDEAGNKAAEKYSKELKELMPGVKISKIELPINEDVNSVYVAHTPDIFTHLLKQRIYFSFSNEKSSEENKNTSSEPFLLPKQAPQPEPIKTASTQQNNSGYLDIRNPFNLIYTGIAASYNVKGGLRQQMDSLRITLQIVHTESRDDHRTKLDLYEYKQVEITCRQASEKLGVRGDLIEKDLSRLTNLLEEYRENIFINNPVETKKIIVKVPEVTMVKCIEFMSKAGLIGRFNELIGKAGVVGEENNRIFLMAIAASYKMEDTLHALIQGTSGSGKTHLLTQILSLMPQEDVICLTRATESSFYNYDEYELSHKLFGMEDTDGLEEKALLAFRELISRGQIISSISYKDEQGNIKAKIKIVRGPIASLSCTTRGDIYEDNMSRCFIIAVDESKEQTMKIINYQNELAAGNINKTEQKQIKEFLQNCMRLVRPYEVINPFANKLMLPHEAHKIRRLNELYQSFVKQITILNQYQRKKDKEGRLISEKEDLQNACEIMFDSIILKIDELDGSLRNFFESLKNYVTTKGSNYEFTRLEIRQALGIKKGVQHYYINRLTELEYLQQIGHANRGFKYKIAYWDSLEVLRERIKKYLNNQLENI